VWLIALVGSVTWAADVVVVSDTRADAPGEAADIAKEIRSLAGSRSLDVQLRYAGFDAAVAAQLLTQAASEKPKVIVAFGALSGSLALSGTVTGVPVVAANPIAVPVQEVPSNVTLLRVQADVAEALADLATLTGESPESVRLALAENLLPFAKKAAPGAPLIALSAQPPPRAAGEGRAVLVGPTSHLAESERRTLVTAWRDAGYVLLLLGASDLPEGAVGAYIADPERNPVARRVALATLDRLDGRTAKPSSVHLPRGNLVLSLTELQRLRVDPPFALLAEADLKGVEGLAEKRDLVSLIEEAIANSPSLAATRARLEGENTDVGRAMSSWLPQADLGSEFVQVDEQLKSAVQSTTVATAHVTVQQLLYNDAARANVGIQLALRRSREAELAAAEQDLALEVASAYISLLRARAIIDIRDADLDRVRLSLEVARQRERAGDASKAEGLRWEAEVANARAELVKAWTDFLAVQVQINQICGASVDRPILATEARVGQQFAERLERPSQLRALSSMAEQFAVDRAPERKQVEEALDAQQRARGIARRAYVMPTVAGQVSVNGDIYRSPVEEVVLPTGDPLVLAEFPPVYWTAGVSASVPVFSGGALRADQRAAEADFVGVEAQLRAVDLGLRSRARVAVQQAHGASVQASFRRTSADAALRGLQAALDAYAAGAANQTTVTEARTNALQTQLLANDAEFQTSLRVYELLRAVGGMPTPRQPNAPIEIRDLLINATEGK
jgi:outer membrane protein TolC